MVIKTEGFPEKDTVVIMEAKVTYMQERDCCNEKDVDNMLEVETVETGAGKYIVIKTERWAIDSVDEMIKVLMDFKKRFK